MREPRTTLDRLLVDRLELRSIQKRFVVRVGRIARFVNISPAFARTGLLDKNAVDNAAYATEPTYIFDRANVMPQPLAHQPLLACEEDGTLFLLDGRQRAYSAFQQGAATVNARIVPFRKAIELGSDEAPGDDLPGRNNRLLEATRSHPVGTKGQAGERRAIVQICADADLPRGRPPQTDLGGYLRGLLLYKTVCAVTSELVIGGIFPKCASVVVNDRSGAEDEILSKWHDKYNIPRASRWKESANEAAAVLNKYSCYHSLPSLKAGLRAVYQTAGETQSMKLRDQELKQRNILLKAYHLYEGGRKHDRKLLKLEETNKKKALASSIAGGGTNIELDFNEQVILAKEFGINPTTLSPTLSSPFDAVFEAHVLAKSIQTQSGLAPPPFLVETFLQRQELDVIYAGNPTDHIVTRVWHDVFEFFRDKKILDAITPEILAAYDAHGVVDGPLPMHLVSERWMVM